MRKEIHVNFLLIAGFSMLLLACEQKTEKKEEVPVVVVEPEPVVEEAPAEEEQLREEVMLIHDRAMLRMSQIRKLSKQLNDSIEHTGVNPMYQEEAINIFRNRLKDLKEADDAMRQWMRNFKQDEAGMSAEEQREYLRKEKQKIQQVEQEMNEAIGAAREVLK
jgi:type IV secretory pathway VirB10-like protein